MFGLSTLAKSALTQPGGLGKLPYLRLLPKVRKKQAGMGTERMNKGEMRERKEKAAKKSNGTSVSELLKPTCKGRVFPLCSIQKEKEKVT